MEEKELMGEKKDTLKISDEVVAVINGVAASETEGVFSVGKLCFRLDRAFRRQEKQR